MIHGWYPIWTVFKTICLSMKCWLVRRDSQLMHDCHPQYWLLKNLTWSTSRTLNAHLSQKKYPYIQSHYLLVDYNLPVVPARGGAEVALKIYIRPFSSIELACAVRQPSPCVRALCESGVLFHMSHLKLHFALHTSHCTLHTPHCTLHTSHSTLLTSHSTLHTSHSTLHTALFTPYTSHCTLHTPHFTLHTPHFTLHSSRPTLHTALFTLHTSSHLSSSHFIPAHLFSSHLFSYVV